MLPQSIVAKISNAIEDSLPGVKYVLLYCDEIGPGNGMGVLNNIPEREKLNQLLKSAAESHSNFKTDQDKVLPS